MKVSCNQTQMITNVMQSINDWISIYGHWVIQYTYWYRHSFCDAYSISGIISTTTNFTNGPNGQYLSKASTILRKAKKKKIHN